MNETDIANAITARLDTLSHSIAWENRDADLTVPYIACQMVRVGKTDPALAGGAAVHQGYAIATVVTQKGAFTTEATNISAEVEALFTKGLRLSITGGTVVITKPAEALTGYQDQSDYRLPVRIDYRAE